MMYLLLAVISSAMVSVVMRLSEGRVRSKMGMLAANYLVCTALAAAMTGTTALFPREEGGAFALALGALSGALYLAGFVALQWNIHRNGVVLPAVFMKLGVMVPTLMAVIVFHETPGAAQAAGFAMALAAIWLIQAEGNGKRAASKMGLLALLVVGGLSDSLAKMYEAWGSARLSGHYLTYTFGFALLLCVLLCVVKKQASAPRDLLFGAVLGVPNYFSARFLLWSLSEIPAVVAYPTYSIGAIVLVTLAGMALFHERLTRRQWIAMGLILAALALLNL